MSSDRAWFSLLTVLSLLDVKPSYGQLNVQAQIAGLDEYSAHPEMVKVI